MAMLSALLDHYAKREKLNLKISASSKFDCTFLYDNRFTYYPVVNETFANYRGTDPIIISWLHSAVENELMTVIIAQKPPYIFLIGGHSFDKQLQLIGYHPYIIPFKQVCLSDYITGDIFRKIPIGVVSRSCTVMYSLKLLELDIRKIIGLENIGIHHALTSDYVTQDIWLRFKGKLYV